MSENKLLSIKGVKKGEYSHKFEENLKLGPITLPLEYEFSVEDNKLNEIEIEIKGIKNCHKFYLLFSEMIIREMGNELNTKFHLTGLAAFGDAMQRDSFAFLDGVKIQASILIKKKNECKMEFEIEKDDEAKIFETINKGIEKYF